MTRIERVEDQRRRAIGGSPPAVIDDANYYPKGDGVYCTRRKRGEEPKVWDASIPCRRNALYRIFFIFLSIAGVIGWIALGLPLW